MVGFALKVEFHPDETQASLTSRLAAANGISHVREFCADMGLDFRAIVSGKHEELRRLYRMADIPENRSDTPPLKYLTSGRAVINGHDVGVRRLASQATRFCPSCLKIDLQNGAGSRRHGPYWRAYWHLNAVRTCPIHEHGMMQVPVGNKTGPYRADFTSFLRPYVHQLDFLIEAMPPRPARFETYICGRVTDMHDDNPFLQSLGLRGIIFLSETIGRVERLGPRSIIESLDDSELSQCAEAGFGVLSGGPDAIRTWLLQLEPEGRGTRKAGIIRTWGTLFTGVTLYRGDDIEPVKEIMREVILSRFPVKPGRVLLDKLVSDRKVYSMTEATAATQMRQTTLRKLLAQHPAADDIRSGTISAEVVNDTLEIMPRLLSLVQARDRLALTTKQFEIFRRHDLIKPAFGLQRNYDKDEIDAFIADLASHAQPVQVPPSFATDLVDTIRARSPIVRLIDHIRADKLDTVFYVNSGKGLRRIWLDLSEVRRKIQPRKSPNRRTL